jgi:hypothetical protein
LLTILVFAQQEVDDAPAGDGQGDGAGGGAGGARGTVRQIPRLLLQLQQM